MTTRYTVLDGEIVSENRAGVQRDYVPDPLGSTVALLDATQAKTDTFEYWPYGESRTHVGASTTPFTFGGTRGYYADSETSYYVRARTLVPTLGRWLTPDPVHFSDSGNTRYSSADNSPVTFTDPSGLFVAMAPLDELINRCKRKCEGRRSTVAQMICMAACVGPKIVKAACRQVACAFVKCPNNEDPCKKDLKILQVCQDCCEICYYCCLMKLKVENPIQCLGEQGGCHEACNCGDNPPPPKC
jgi:RHS repeat-associated protein